MDIAKIEGYGFQWEIYLSGHQIKMINVGRQSKISVRASLVCGNDKPSIIDLELHETQARRLIALGIGGTEKQDIIL